MGRAMLIIVAGVLLSVGITQTSLFGGLGLMVGHSANYAEAVQAKNIAYMGTELAIRQMIDNPPDWENNSTFIFSDNIGGGNAAVTVEVTPNGMLRMISNGSFNGDSQQITLLMQQNQNSAVPTFFSALGFIMSDFDKFTFSAGGNTTIDGHDISGQCEDKPGVSVNHSEDIDTVEDGIWGSGKVLGDPPIDTFNGLTMDELSKLIDQLEPYGTVLNPNQNQHNLGSKEEPGIFVVNSNVRFAGSQNKGAGIMIVRNSGNIEVEEGDDSGSLELRGGFEFDGLVIFENALNIDGRGNATIRGSVIVGNTHQNAPKFFADMGGAANIKYDCSAQQYADMAASGLGSSMNFQTLSVYETSDNSGN